MDLPREAAERLSREVLIVCAFDGSCLWADARAGRAFGAAPGARVDAWIDPGSRGKFAALLDRVRGGPVRDWELCFIARGAPTTYSFDAEVTERGVLLVGTTVPSAQTSAVAACQEAIAELSDMHRDQSRQKSELEQANRRLSDSNQGLVSLHAELDEKNDSLRRSADVKGRLIANVSHEFRTPINSILGLARLLLDRMDGDLSAEQETQVQFIRTNAETLRALIDDILDLSKIEAGKVSLRPRTFAVSELMAGLRGTMAAVQRAPGVDLFVEEANDLPPMTSDDGKIGQILRNLVSNALKFTDEGSVRVLASAGAGDRVVFRVVDTGIGIARADQERIFEEFAQVDTARRVKGTGLGLSVSRRLATMLGGDLSVESAPGRGSTFALSVPRVHLEASQMEALVERSRVLDPRRSPVLVVEDDRQTMFLYERYLSQSGFQVIPARTTDEARTAMTRVRPAAIVLDVMLETESSWRFLREVKENPETSEIPVMVVTVVDSSQKARALGADEFWLKPIDPERVLRKLTELAKRGPVAVLVVDDDESSRYLIRRLLDDTPFVLHEAANAEEAIRLAREKLPQVILLDFMLGESTAFDVIDELKAHSKTRGIPIIIQTAKNLEAVERERLARDATAILSKQSLSRELAISRIREALENAGVRAGGSHGG